MAYRASAVVAYSSGEAFASFQNVDTNVITRVLAQEIAIRFMMFIDKFECPSFFKNKLKGTQSGERR
jgi:hypothetical protein